MRKLVNGEPMYQTSSCFDRLKPREVFISESSVCHCPKCWNLDPEAKHYEKTADLRPVHVVQFSEDGHWLRAIERGFLSRGEALVAANTLDVRVDLSRY